MLCWRVLIAYLDGGEGASGANRMVKYVRAFVASLMSLLGMTRDGQLEELRFSESSLLWPSPGRDDAYIERMRRGYRNKYAEHFARSGAGYSRRVFWTRGGHLGLATNGVAEGDLVCLFPESRVPFIIRGPVAVFAYDGDTREYHHLVCEACVQGVMPGELCRLGTLAYRTLHII